MRSAGINLSLRVKVEPYLIHLPTDFVHQLRTGNMAGNAAQFLSQRLGGFGSCFVDSRPKLCWQCPKYLMFSLKSLFYIGVRQCPTIPSVDPINVQSCAKIRKFPTWGDIIEKVTAMNHLREPVGPPGTVGNYTLLWTPGVFLQAWNAAFLWCMKNLLQKTWRKYFKIPQSYAGSFLQSLLLLLATWTMLFSFSIFSTLTFWVNPLALNTKDSQPRRHWVQAVTKLTN